MDVEIVQCVDKISELEPERSIEIRRFKLMELQHNKIKLNQINKMHVKTSISE